MCLLPTPLHLHPSPISPLSLSMRSPLRWLKCGHFAPLAQPQLPPTHTSLTPQTPTALQFFEVTQIADAVALWKSLQERQQGGAAEEEFEDEQVCPVAFLCAPLLFFMAC